MIKRIGAKIHVNIQCHMYIGTFGTAMHMGHISKCESLWLQKPLKRRSCRLFVYLSFSFVSWRLVHFFHHNFSHRLLEICRHSVWLLNELILKVQSHLMGYKVASRLWVLDYKRSLESVPCPATAWITDLTCWSTYSNMRSHILDEIQHISTITTKYENTWTPLAHFPDRH